MQPMAAHHLVINEMHIETYHLVINEMYIETYHLVMKEALIKVKTKIHQLRNQTLQSLTAQLCRLWPKATVWIILSLSLPPSEANRELNKIMTF